MNGSFFDMLIGILGLSGHQHAPEIGGTLLSFLFMGVMVLFKFVFPLLGLLTGAKPASLPRQMVEVLVSVALTCACWLLPISSLIDISLVPFLSFAALTFVITAVTSAKILRLIGSLLKLALAHTAAAVIPDREQSVPITTYQQAPAPFSATGPVKSSSSLSQLIEAGFRNGTIVPFVAVGAFAIGALVSEVVFGASGMIIGSPLIDTSTVAQVGDVMVPPPHDIRAGMASAMGRIACTLAIFGLVLLGVSRYAARRGLHYEGDPWEKLAQSVRIKRKEANAWEALDEAVRRNREG